MPIPFLIPLLAAGVGAALSRSSGGSAAVPPQPAAPDLAAANLAGINADIATLPLRRRIDAAARLGQNISYIDPQTGREVTQDFTGLGDATYGREMAQLMSELNADMQQQQLALRRELGVQNAEQTAAEIRAADPTAYETRQTLTGRLLGDLNAEPTTVAPNAGLFAAYDRLSDLAGNAPDNDGRLKAIYDAASRIDTSAGDGGANGLIRSAILQGQDAGGRSRLNSIYAAANQLPTGFNDVSMDALHPALASAVRDYSLGGRLNDAETREVSNNVRAGQAARGNFLGDAAAVQEGVALNAQSEAKKQQRFQNLLSIQQQIFGQNDVMRDDTQQANLDRIGVMSGVQGQGFTQAQQRAASLAGMAQQLFGNEQSVRGEQRSSELAKIGAMAGLAGQDFGQNQAAYNSRLNSVGSAMGGAATIAQEERAARGETFGQGQQALANASAMVLGQPITNQFGSLGHAQQGAVGFTPVNFNSGIGLNPTAGAQGASFAQGNFGNLANMWGQNAQIAAQGNPWMGLVGNVVGSVAGGASVGLGQRLGNSLWGGG